MVKIKFKTLKEDYIAALKTPCIPVMASNTCFIAQAVNRVTGRKCHVGSRTLRFDDNGKIVELPEPVQAAIQAFDRKRAFTEVEWELELETVKK